MGLFFVTVFNLPSTSFAQNNQLPTTQSIAVRSNTNSWFGLNAGFINGSYPLGLALHFGVKNPEAADLRLSGSLQFRDGASSIGLGVDVLRTFSEAQPLRFYGGGGGFIAFENSSFLIDGHGLVGVEYNFAESNLEEIGIFIEVRIGAAGAIGGGIPQPPIPSAGAVVGLNIYF